MLYLAEVRKTKGFMGAKTELKLLACERNDKSWSAVPGEEIVTADELGNFGDGALIFANVNNRQIQGTPEAAVSRLMGILQNFSRLMEKTKSQEEEIEQWKQSLTYQADELNRRQQEMEARLEELEGAEEELQKLAAQRAEVEKLKAEADQLKADFARKEGELSSAWEQIQGERQKLEGLQSEVRGAGLDPQQTAQVKHIFEQIQGAIAPTDDLLGRLSDALQYVAQHKEQLDQTLQSLDQDQAALNGLQAEIEAIANELKQQEHDLNEKTHSLEDAKSQLQIQRQLLHAKQDYLQYLDVVLQNQESIQETLNNLVAGIGDGDAENVDIGALESMPLGELEGIVTNLKAELDKLVRFVNDQEEELTLQQESVNELKVKIQGTDGNNVMAMQELEEELKDEQEQIGMLNETLVGQRRTLRERQSVMRQHLQVLKRRQGIIEVEVEQNIDLSPAIARIEVFQQDYQEQKQKLESEIDSIQQTLKQLEGILASQETDLKQQNDSFSNKRKEYHDKQLVLEKVQAKVELLQTNVQPLQGSLESVSQPLRELEQLTNQFVTASQQQHNLATELENTLGPLMQG